MKGDIKIVDQFEDIVCDNEVYKYLIDEDDVYIEVYGLKKVDEEYNPIREELEGYFGTQQHRFEVIVKVSKRITKYHRLIIELPVIFIILIENKNGRNEIIIKSDKPINNKIIKLLKKYPSISKLL